jgi:anti-anti-sigma factor
MSEIASLSLARDEGIAVADLSGEIDLSNAEDMRDRIAQWATNEDRALIVDFTNVSYTDSTGLNLVFDLWRRLSDHGQAFGAVVPTGSQTRRVFDVVGVESQIHVFETKAEAHAWAMSESVDAQPNEEGLP